VVIASARNVLAAFGGADAEPANAIASPTLQRSVVAGALMTAVGGVVPARTRVVAQCRDADFERLVRSTFGMDAKVELTVATGAFAETVRKLDTEGATVAIIDVDPASEADFAALIEVLEGQAGTTL